MARDRQHAKRRQAERREARLRARGRAATADDGAEASAPPTPRESDGRTGGGDGAAAAGAASADRAAEPAPDPATEAQLAAAAPPERVGRSDTVVEAPPPAPELDQPDRPAASRAERDRAGGEGRRRGRVLSFLVAVWAELQRVQWPDRQTLTTLTGVVLGFVLVAGAYLGGLDAIFSRVIQAIL